MSVKWEIERSMLGQVGDEFLLNTLNNLYSMSLLEDGRLTDSLVKLSDFFRYQYRVAKLDKISIEEEVQFLKSYFYLQRLRFNNQLDINFIYSIDRNHYISPCVFFPLLSLSFQMLQRRVVDKLGFSVHLHAKENNIDLVLEILKPDNFKPSVFSAELDACLENLRTEYKGQFKVSVEERLNQYVVGVVLTPWVDA